MNVILFDDEFAVVIVLLILIFLPVCHHIKINITERNKFTIIPYISMMNIYSYV